MLLAIGMTVSSCGQSGPEPIPDKEVIILSADDNISLSQEIFLIKDFHRHNGVMADPIEVASKPSFENDHVAAYALAPDPVNTRFLWEKERRWNHRHYPESKRKYSGKEIPVHTV